MWRLSMLFVAACTRTIAPPPATPTTVLPTAVPLLRLDLVDVELERREPTPLVAQCTTTVLDPEMRRKLISETNELWNTTRDEFFRDYSAITEDLPPLGSVWERRVSLPYRGVVAVYLDPVFTASTTGGPLMLSLVDTDTRSARGAGWRFELLPSVEPPNNGTTSSFSPLWVEPRTGRSLGPIHAALALRPHGKASHYERQRIVVYNPRDRPDIVLVAYRPYFGDRWTPLLRVDLPHATRFSVYERAPSH